MGINRRRIAIRLLLQVRLYRFFRLMFLGKRFELPLLVESLPLRSVRTVAASDAGQPVPRWQAVEVITVPRRRQRLKYKKTFFIMGQIVK
jgi:hypothetical protein